MTTMDDAAMETLHRAMKWAEAPAGRCAACRTPATHHLVSPMGVISEPLCIDHAFEESGVAETPGRWTVKAIPGASRPLALRAEVLRLRAECAALRGAARAHLAADDAASLARRTDAADVPTAEARALAARECLAGLVGYTGEVGR